MGLWKRIKENRLEKAAKVRERRQKAILPKSVLLWIDAAYNDAPARFVRGLAIAEAFRQAGVERVSLACLENANAPAEMDARDLQWIDVRPNRNPITFNEIVKRAEADLTIADSASPPRLQNDADVLLCLLADGFSVPLLEADWIDAVLMPGFIIPPDFESVHVLPSRIGDCIHGEQYVSLPSVYAESQDAQKDRVLIAVSGNVSSESVQTLINAVRGSWTGTIAILADVSPSVEQRLKQELSGEFELEVDPPLQQRLSLLRQAKLVLMFPSLHVYEFLTLRTPVVLVPRSEAEAAVCRLILDRNAARVIPASESAEVFESTVKELLESNEACEHLGANAGELVTAEGANELAEALLSRFDRLYKGRHTT